MRKTFLVIIVLFCSAVSAFADGRSNEVLSRLGTKLKSYGTYEVIFTASAEDMGTSKGSYIVSGNKYRIKVDLQEQFSNGKDQYEVNGYDKEITIDHVDSSSRNLLTNPARAFDFSSDVFTGRYVGRSGSNEIVELTPKAGVLDGVSRIELHVDAESGLPTEMKYDFNGSPLSIKINQIKPHVAVNDSMFEFRKEDYKGYEVIDFR